MTPAQNRAMRSVLLTHMRHLDGLVAYLETAPGVRLKDTIYGGIRGDISYQRASVRAAIHQLEDQYDKSNPNKTRSGRPSIPATAGSGSPYAKQAYQEV